MCCVFILLSRLFMGCQVSIIKEFSLHEAHSNTTRLLLGLGRYAKRTLLVIGDIAALNFALWLAYSLRLGKLYVAPTLDYMVLLGIAPLIGVAALAQSGLYRRVTRYTSTNQLTSIAAALALAILAWATLIFMLRIEGTPRSVLFLFWVFGVISVWGLRQLSSLFLGASLARRSAAHDTARQPVLIYGAGRLGVDLAASLARSPLYALHGFVDRSPSLWGQVIAGYRVRRPSDLAGLINHAKIKEILVALPSKARVERMSVLSELEKYKVQVRILPEYDEFATTPMRLEDLRPVTADDLLGREPVPPRPDLMARSVFGKAVLVTGAGGSIGSELVRQILRLEPSRLVLLDVSENALFKIHKEVTDWLLQSSGDQRGSLEVVPVLGSVLDSRLVSDVLGSHRIRTIFHAAAYKHVPLVQWNPSVGILNNTFGTFQLAAAAEEAGVERFVLISTDKAVRPSSLMGASKRLAEMVVQAHAHKPRQSTVFTMVRFGNVLDSSGSVVEVFREQIKSGGPVTVTHPDMVRYFMSIPEAATLVIQAGAMATGGEVFVLDMGEPVKIDTLARSMIRLMGATVRDEDSPDCGIAIKYIGLRPGEKLKEELLIGSDTVVTEHPRIQRVNEPWMPHLQLEGALATLFKLLADGDMQAVHELLHRVVEGYHIGGPAGSYVRTPKSTEQPHLPMPVIAEPMSATTAVAAAPLPSIAARLTPSVEPGVMLGRQLA